MKNDGQNYLKEQFDKNKIHLCCCGLLDHFILYLVCNENFGCVQNALQCLTHRFFNTNRIRFDSCIVKFGCHF